MGNNKPHTPMLEAYRQHVEERAEQGIPPLPLNAEQVAELVAC
jgi:aconitate hydratase 2/2-methylisocitrate dehydratase